MELSLLLGLLEQHRATILDKRMDDGMVKKRKEKKKVGHSQDRLCCLWWSVTVGNVQQLQNGVSVACSGDLLRKTKDNKVISHLRSVFISFSFLTKQARSILRWHRRYRHPNTSLWKLYNLSLFWWTSRCFPCNLSLNSSGGVAGVWTCNTATK